VFGGGSGFGAGAGVGGGTGSGDSGGWLRLTAKLMPELNAFAHVLMASGSTHCQPDARGSPNSQSAPPA